MEKTKKILNLISLVVLVGTNVLSPVGYAIDDGVIESPANIEEKTKEEPPKEETTKEDKESSDNNTGDKVEPITDSTDNSNEGEDKKEDATINSGNNTTGGKTTTGGNNNQIDKEKVDSDVTSGTVSSNSGTVIDTLKEMIEDNIKNLSGDVEVLTGEVEILTGEAQELTGSKLELSKARKTLNSAPIIKEETFDELGIKVKVKALSGTFPENTKPEIILVQGQEHEKVKKEIADDPTNDVSEDDEMITFDIKFIYTLSDGTGVEVPPKENTVEVTFNYYDNKELQEAEKADDQEIQIFHVDDKGENDVEPIDINETKSKKVEDGVVIDAESFSYYTIVVQRREEAPESAPTQTWQYGKDYGIISIARPTGLSASDFPIEGFTIMDRNLGASISGTTCNTTNATGACGYLYQWGNNYGFPISANASSILTGVGLTWDDSYNNNGYVSKSFINGSNFGNDVWSDSSHHDGVWGGANDVNYASTKNSNGLYWDDGGDRTLRQGPCPEGWHVPSAGEWSMLLDYWYYTNYTAHPSVSNNLYYFSDSTKRQAFMDYFYIPFAGYRNYSNATLDSQGSYGYYWSSSPYGSDYPDNARYLHLNSSDVDADYGDYRALGNSVRCFKDSYVASPESSNLVDTQAWVEGEDFETITISNPDNSNEGFTIMDRNLGATATGYGASASADSYGFKYQWGNNFGFRDSDSVTAVTAGLTYNSIYDNHGYYSTNFINGSSHDYDVWDGANPTTSSNTEHNDGLWGGANDSSSNNRGANQTNPTDRQGPCPVGYHVPSAGEWGLLIKYWADTKDNGTTKNATYGGSAGLYYLSSNHSAFQQKFNLPFAGYRFSSDASLYNQGSNGLYWSSSPYGSGRPYDARYLYLSSSRVGAGGSYYRAYGYSVRCFKDSYVAPKTYTLTFDSQGGSEVPSQTVVEGQTRSRPAQNPTKTNWNFGDWYTSTGYTTLFDFSTPASANTTVYAKWNDGKAPSNVSVTTTSNEKATSQTATLSCTDEIGVTKYYWGTSGSPNDSAYTTVTSTTSFSTTQPVSSAGTYYLFCKDAAGNTSTSATKTYYSYSVQNMLDKVSGTQGTYNTTNYETNGSSMGTYIIPSGTTIILNSTSLYGDPMSSHDTYAGYTTSNSGTPTTSNPTISANTTYYRWYNRDSHTLTLNKGTGVSSVSGAGTHKHGASVSISATPNTSAGYSFTSWTVNNGNNPANTTNASTTVTITQNTTLIANASDTTAPTIEINTQPSTSCAISKTVKATITDGVGVDTRQYAIISSSTCNSSIASTATWNSYTNESNITLDNENLNDKYICFRASDEAGNTSYLATNQITNIDTAGPGTPSLSLPADNTYTNNNKPTLTWTAGSIAGCSTLANYEIQICSDSSCNTVEQSNTSATNATWTPTTALNDGTYYWRVREKDSLNRYSDYTSTKSFIVDTTAPTAPTCTANACYKGSKAVTCTSAETPIRYTTDGSAPTCSSSSWTNQSFSATTTLKVAVCDPAGNLSDVNTYTYTADNSAPSVPTMTAEPEYTQGLSNAVTSSTVTDNGCNGNVQYQFCKSTTNSTTNCSDTNLGNWLDTAGTTFTNLTDGQKYYYFVRTKDGLGNTSEWSESVSSTQDNSAPAISFTNKVKQGPSKVDDVSVDWKDATVRKWKYSDTDSCPTSYSSYNKTDSDTMNQSDETNNGKYICLYAEDEAGNATQLASAYPINIDITSPTCIISGNPENWTNQSVTLTVTMADTNVKSDGYSRDDEEHYGNTTTKTISNNGTYVAYVKDLAGNTGTCNVEVTKIDKVAPTITINNPDTTPAQSKTITASTDKGTLYMAITGANVCDNTLSFESYQEKIFNTESDNGKYVCYKAEDAAGNVKYEISAQIEGIDITAPTCTITGNPTSPTNQNVELTLNYDVEANQIDNGYSWNNITYSSTKTHTVSTNGTYTAYVKDAAGNTGSCSVTVDKIDKVLPIITINNPTTTPAQSKTITATTDKGTLYMAITGVNVCDGSLDFVAYESITFDLESDNGKYVCYKAEDVAGNEKYEISAQIEGIKEPSKSSESSSSSNYSGGGGRRTPVKLDTHGSAESGDKIDNVVDIDTGDIVGENKSEEENNQDKNGTQTSFTQEQIDAYTWAKGVGITTKPTIESAKLNTDITREQLAKMMVVYMSKVLGKQPVISKTAKYLDVNEKNRGQEMYDYIQLAYKYQIMGINYKGEPIRYFNPAGKVTRAEFATVLSRVLYGSKYNQGGAKYYEQHLKALKDNGILTNVNPEMKELRGNVMLMLMRSVK